MMTSSGAARRGLPFFGPYSATKAAQLSLAEAMRVELKPDQIAVTSVHPVGTSTEFFDVAGKAGTVSVAGIGSRGRQQTPEHVARADGRRDREAQTRGLARARDAIPPEPDDPPARHGRLRNE